MSLLFGFRELISRSAYKKEKIFCIGLNKTGTSSMEKALREFGYKLGDQYTAEMLMPEFGKRNFKPIVRYCLSADAFQDLPFSCFGTFIILDQCFPNAKFILTVRDSADQWVSSLTRFHSKLYGKNGNVPDAEDLRNAMYRYKGFTYTANRIMFPTPDSDIYNHEMLVNYYNLHNESVREYFRLKKNLLEINVADDDAYNKLCKFLNKQPVRKSFEWINKT